jgi:hypothetical protein
VSKIDPYLLHLVHQGNLGPPPEPPLFDWKDQLEDADAIIWALKQPRPTEIGSRRNKPTPGLDLSAHRESLARFLADLGEGYEVARQDFNARHHPDRPKQKLEDNWKDEGRPDLERAYEATGDGGLDFDWAEFWTENYARGRGYPGYNRTPTKQDDARPPIHPVRKNYPAIEGWWKRTTGKNFGPKFARPASAEVEAEPFDRNNPAARFLILVVQYLDRKYDPANARGLVDTVKRQRAGGRKNGRKNMPPKVRE